MGTTPPIALDVRPPAQQPGPLDLYKEGLSVQSMINQQALQKQAQAANVTAQQSNDLALRQQQQESDDRDKFNAAFHDVGGDWDKAIASAPAAGVSGQYILKTQLARTDQVSKMATMHKDLLANEAAQSDQFAKDAYAVRQIDDPAEKQAQYTRLINGHITAGTLKPGQVSSQVPSDQDLDTTIAHNKATQDMIKEAQALQEQKAKLPGEQAESTAKGYSAAAQTMGGANEQLSWTARRNLAIKNNPDLAQLIPEQYSPQAAEQVRQLGVAPKDLAAMAPDKLEMQDFLKHPPRGYPGTPVGFMQFKADQSANAQVRAVQMLTGGGAGGAGGGGAQPAAPAGQPASAPSPAPANAPGGWVGTGGRTLAAVNPMLRGRLQAILEYRQPDPPQGARGPVPQALSNLVAEFDPQHDATTYPAKNKILTEYVKDASSGDLGAINTALGHLGELNTAAQALSQRDLPLLHSLASKVGAATGGDAETTYKAILHRVGPEMTSAYVKGGGGQAERGANEEDFDLSKGAKQIQSNIAESAMLLNSKLDSKRNNWDNTFKPYRDQDKFDNRFITPSARATLDSLSAKAPTNKANFAAPQGAPSAPKEDGHKLKQGGQVIAVSKGGRWVAP